jgi:hypothetical protein
VTTTYPTRSRQQLVDRALRILGVVPAGQTPDADDREVVDAFVVPLLARLDGEGITTIPDPEAIPAAQFLDVAILLAAAAAADFGLAALPQDDPTKSEIRLRTIVSVGPTMETVEDYDSEGEEITYERPATLHGEYF